MVEGLLPKGQSVFPVARWNLRIPTYLVFLWIDRRKLGPNAEKITLDLGYDTVDRFISQRRFQQTEECVQFVNAPIGANPRMVFRNSPPSV